MSLFGPLRHGGEIEDAVLASLQLWLPDYLREVERQAGLDAEVLEGPRSIGWAPEMTKWPEDQLPSLIVVSPGTSEDPERDGEGVHRARFALNVGVVASAADERDTRRLAQLYGAVVRGCLLQHRILAEEIQVVAWNGEGYDDIPQAAEMRRTVALGLNRFTVEIGDLVSDTQGPGEPTDGGDPGDWPVIDPAPAVQVTKES